ncbi:MAG: hypothetical protein CO129_02805 [Ignavibacteriales bacterium CG_4_9_14_3_um_filter_34_10]|nr:MAG: hypothetical protein CO129_02805 [Ignavibacteriales bacterium CG_4_9_14_3_um_filter_34_10]
MKNGFKLIFFIFKKQFSVFMILYKNSNSAFSISQVAESNNSVLIHLNLLLLLKAKTKIVKKILLGIAQNLLSLTC